MERDLPEAIVYGTGTTRVSHQALLIQIVTTGGDSLDAPSALRIFVFRVRSVVITFHLLACAAHLVP